MPSRTLLLRVPPGAGRARRRTSRLMAGVAAAVAVAGVAGVAGAPAGLAAAVPAAVAVPAAARAAQPAPARAAAPVPAAAPAYRLVDLGVIGAGPAGQQGSSAGDVNATGRIVGSSTYPGGVGAHAFVRRGGSLRDLGDGLDGFAESSAAAVSDAGTVVGSAHVVSRREHPHAVLWREGKPVDLGTGYGAGTGSGSWAADVNRSGLVVGGHYRTVAQPRRAALWSGGRIRDLGTLGGSSTSRYDTESEATAVNDRGQVVGAALPAGGHPLHGFLWQDGRMQDLGTLGGNGNATVATGINEHGAVVGFSETAAGALHAFRWRDGRMRDLGRLGPDFAYSRTTASDINDAGVVVGRATVRGGVYGTGVGFLWRDGVMTDLNTLVQLPLGRRIDDVAAISNAGVVVGTMCEIATCEAGGTRRAVALVPR